MDISKQPEHIRVIMENPNFMTCCVTMAQKLHMERTLSADVSVSSEIRFKDGLWHSFSVEGRSVIYPRKER